MGVIEGVSEGAAGVDVLPVDGRKVALHVVDRTVFRTGEDRTVGGHNGLIKEVGIVFLYYQRFYRFMCFYVNGPYITISATKISKGFVAVDGKSGDVGHFAAKGNLGDLFAGFNIDEESVGLRSDQQLAAVNQQAPSGISC